MRIYDMSIRHIVSLLFLMLMLQTSYFSQQASAADQYVPGTEAVMRAINERNRAVSGGYFIWMNNDVGQNPGEYPADGFYAKDSSARFPQLGNSIVNNMAGVTTLFISNPSELDGYAAPQVTLTSLYQTINWGSVSNASLHVKLAFCISVLSKTKHVLKNGLGTLVVGRVVRDQVIDPNPDGRAPRNQDSGWVGPGSALATIIAQSTTQVLEIYQGTLWYRGVTKDTVCNAVSYSGSIFPGSKGGSVRIFVRVKGEQTNTMNFSSFGEIADDNTYHEVPSLRCSVDAGGIFTSEYHPSMIMPPRAAPVATTFQVSGPGYEQWGSTSPLNQWSRNGECAILSLNFETPTIGSPKPECIDKCACKNSTAPGSGDTGAPTDSMGNSHIDNTQRVHFHTATDYTMPSDSSADCVPCGNVTQLSDSLPSLNIARTHRYADLAWHGSFGPGAFLNYDIQLTIDAATKSAQLFDPSLTAPVDLSDGMDLDGIYTDEGFKTVKSLRLQTANGTLTTDPAAMRRAVLTTLNDQLFTFDIFLAADGVTDSLLGRLTSIADRNGNVTTISYLDANAQVGDAQLNYDRQRLWRINRVTDTYGKFISFGWQRSAGQWVVSTIATPSGGVITYRYDLNNLTGLNQIVFPDGTTSSFSTLWDATTLHQQLIIADAGAEDIHRNKTLYLTTGRTIPFGGSSTTNQSPNRIWQVKNGAGEVSYRNMVTGGSSGDYALMVYEGGGATSGTVKKIDFDGLGRPVSVTRASSGISLSNNVISASGWRTINNYMTDSQHRVADETDPVGERVQYIRNYAGSVTNVLAWSPTGVQRNSQSTSYNAYEQPLIFTDRLNRVTEYQYDAKGNLLHKIAAKGSSVQATWHWTYNSRGQPLSATDANGNVTTFVYEENSSNINYKRLISVIEPADVPGGAQAVTLFAYDSAGRLWTSTDAENRTATRSYDTRNRLKRITYQDTTYEEFTYGSGINANLSITHRDRNGNVETMSYDAAGRRTGITMTSPSNVIAGQSSWTYLDGKSLILTETLNGDTTNYAYDNQLRQIAVTRSPRAGVTLTTQTVYGDDQRVNYEQDAYGRKTYYAYEYRGLPQRTVRERIAGSLVVPESSQTERVGYLYGLSRASTINPPYVIEDSYYDHEEQMAERVDGRGTKSLMEWDSQGRMNAQVESAIDASTIPATIVPYAARTEFGYDAQGNRTAIIKPRSFVRNPTTGVFTPAASTYLTTSTYTGRNLLKSVTEASGTIDQATVNFTYSLTKQKATQSDPRNAAWLTTFTYHSCCNRLYQALDPQGFATTFTYDHIGNVLTTRDANNTGVTKTYDARNRPLTITNTENETSTVTYDDNLVDAVGLSNTYATAINGLGLVAGSDGSAVEVKNHLGEATVEIRDGVGRVLRRVDGNGNKTTVTYDGLLNGLVTTTVTDALGNTTISRVDGSGLVREAVDAEGHLSTATFDANGNQLTARDPLNVGWTAVYDLRNRRLTTTDTHSDASHATYDLHNNVLTTTDSMTKVTTMTYDFRDRKITLTDRLTSAGVTSYEYDQANHLTKIKDADSAANGVTDYTYNNRGLLATETFPAGKDGKRTVRTYGYDNGRRLLTRSVTTSPVAVPALNEVTTYGYDFANRLTSRSYNDGKGNDGFTYDDASRLLTAVSGRYGSTVVRAYTGNAPAEKGGRLTSERLDLSGANAGSWTVGYHYDAVNRLDDLSYPSGDHAIRGYTVRHQLQSVTFGGTSVATRGYDNSGRLTTTTFGNGLVETRTYRSDAGGVDHQLATQAIPGVTNFAYAYDANKRITTETNNQFTAQTQQFVAYDNENRLTSWSRGTDSQTWTLSKVGDWTSTTINGVAQTRSHDAVHEVTAIGVTPINYDLKGNLTQNQDGAAYQWDSENRLANATISDTTVGINDVATYRYDALGRRVQKTAFGVATTFVHAGAQVVHEFDAKIQLPAASATDDGNGLGTPPGGGILQGAGVTRFNYQPSLSPIPPGFFADKGSVYSVRSNGKSYGWQTTARTDTLIRNQHPLLQFDSFNQAWLNNTGSAGTWEIALANGTYPVIVVMGDCASANQTNNVTIEGQVQIDPDPAVTTPPAYRRGDFDGYAVTATVADGKLTLSIPGTALNPKVCFIEIGPLGSSITQADRDRLAAAIVSAGDATGAPAFPKVQPSPRLYAYGSYVDEPLLLKAGTNRYYYATNRLYSVAALTSQLGQVVERYMYDAYGRQTVLANNGIVAYKPSDYGQFVGFTGRYHDWETGLEYFRARYFDLALGRFINRDPAGYVDGSSLYNGYFVPNGVDPSGMYNEAGHYYTVYIVAIAVGYSPKEAEQLATWTQYSDENPAYDATNLGSPHVDDVQKYLHSLTGGDSDKLRGYLSCLLRNGGLTPEEKGFVLHAFGDAYAHSYQKTTKEYTSTPFGLPTFQFTITKSEVQYPGPVGHGLHGHLPDFIVLRPELYSQYVDGLSATLTLMRGGEDATNVGVNMGLINALQASPSMMANLINQRFEDEGRQNAEEIRALLDVAGKHGVKYTSDYRPETQAKAYNPNFPAGKWSSWDSGAMGALIQKIKKGTSECCPPSK